MPRVADPHLRERLIAAATIDFAEQGYAGATLDGIAARAGVTKGGIYFHFAGKEELFFAVLDHWRDRRRRLLQVVLPGGGGAVASLRVLATELRGRFTARLREDDRQEQRWLRANLRELLVLGVRDGTLAVDDPALTAFVLAASVRGVLEQWQTSAPDVETYCQAEQLARLLVARHATGAAVERADGSDPDFDFRPGRPG